MGVSEIYKKTRKKMKRIIKFRCQNKDGKWLYGTLIDCICFRSILNFATVSETPIDLLGAEIILGKVVDGSIGQYIGLQDFNHEDIYEGDVLRFRDEPDMVFIVAYNNKIAAFGLVIKEMWKDRQYGYAWRYFSTYHGRDFEIIGNIYDKPELLNS